MSSSDKVLVIISGGTIDAESYKQTPKDIKPLRQTIIPSVIEKELKYGDQCVCYDWLRKDSKYFSDYELKSLAHYINNSEHDKIVITHGTDKMPENARNLQRFLDELSCKKTVIFTGAMVPVKNQLDGYEKSDGIDNLKFSIDSAKTAGQGVFIGFNNKLFNPLKTIKDFINKKFIEKNLVEDKSIPNPLVAKGEALVSSVVAGGSVLKPQTPHKI